MLCSYVSALQMACAANLLSTAWAGVYNWLADRQRDLTCKADALANNPFIQEEESIQVSET